MSDSDKDRTQTQDWSGPTDGLFNERD